jgi:hypothetical protein
VKHIVLTISGTAVAETCIANVPSELGFKDNLLPIIVPCVEE